MEVIDQLIKRPACLTTKLNAFLIVKSSKGFSDIRCYRSARAQHLVRETELLFGGKGFNNVSNVFSYLYAKLPDFQILKSLNTSLICH